MQILWPCSEMSEPIVLAGDRTFRESMQAIGKICSRPLFFQTQIDVVDPQRRQIPVWSFKVQQ